MTDAETSCSEPVRALTRQLHRAIVSGRFSPNQRLIETELAREFETNRATLRSALAVLEGEGLVVRDLNRGARVKEVGETEAIEIAEVCAVLEAMVAGLAAKRATSADRKEFKAIAARMKAAVEAGDFVAFSDMNGQLHEKIHSIAGNATAIRILQNLKSQIVRIQFRAILLSGRVPESRAELRDIVRAIVKGDPHAAEKAMRRHLSNVLDALKRAIASQRMVLK